MNLKCLKTALTNNQIEDIIKVTRSLENRKILLKGTTNKISSQKRGFLNFLRPLMTADLPLMKSVLTPLAESVLLSAAASATENFGVLDYTNIFK